MGALSRNFDSWRNHVHLHARNLGPGGQMATLMHEELESISDQARQMNSMQQRSVAAMQSGFNQMNDAVGHLAWVQQRAHEEQLTAQYRVMQLQADTVGELGRANETLAVMSTQLAEVADILRELKGTQDEHLQIVKAERTLKEVLFQLSTMLEEMIVPEDEVARLCLCQFALNSLDHHSLNTSHLSDLADKREFAAFVKKTRQIVRDTPPEIQADLLAFEVWYKGYDEARAATPSAFEPLPAPPWQPNAAPLWQPLRGPVWVEMPEPSLVLRRLRPKPKEHAHPGEHPLPEQFGPMPNQIFVGGNLVDYPYQRVAPGTFTPDTVPTYEDTKARLPFKGRGFMQFLDSMFCSAEWANARKFEESLRSWAERVKKHEAYVIDLAAWTAEEIEITRQNEEIEKIHYPAELEQFRVTEAARRLQYEADRAAFEAEEEQRRASYDRELAQHQEQEKQRHETWQQEMREHAAREESRLEQWNKEITDFAFKLQEQGKTINEFLEEHPDIQLMYSKVDWEEDAHGYKTRTSAGSAAQAFSADPFQITVCSTLQPEEEDFCHAEAGHNESAWQVVLEGFPKKAKIEVIKVIRGATGLGLKEAKELVEAAPVVITTCMSEEDAKALAGELSAIRCKVSVGAVAASDDDDAASVEAEGADGSWVVLVEDWGRNKRKCIELLLRLVPDRSPELAMAIAEADCTEIVLSDCGREAAVEFVEMIGQGGVVASIRNGLLQSTSGRSHVVIRLKYVN